MRRECAAGRDRLQSHMFRRAGDAHTTRTGPVSRFLGVCPGDQRRLPATIRGADGRDHAQRQCGVEEALRGTAGRQAGAADSACGEVGIREVRARLDQRFVGAGSHKPDPGLTVELGGATRAPGDRHRACPGCGARQVEGDLIDVLKTDWLPIGGHRSRAVRGDRLLELPGAREHGCAHIAAIGEHRRRTADAENREHDEGAEPSCRLARQRPPRSTVAHGQCCSGSSATIRLAMLPMPGISTSQS